MEISFSQTPGDQLGFQGIGMELQFSEDRLREQGCQLLSPGEGKGWCCGMVAQSWSFLGSTEGLGAPEEATGLLEIPTATGPALSWC